MIILEAFCDYSLWIWHAAVGWGGCKNDINVFDTSPLLQSFLDGTFSKEIDFEYMIAD